MQKQARRAFLEDALNRLLGQDSPTGFTDRVVTEAEKYATKVLLMGNPFSRMVKVTHCHVSVRPHDRTKLTVCQYKR